MKNKVEPISPDALSKDIPDEVITAFNTIITREWDGCLSIVRQAEVVEEVIENFKKSGIEINSQEIYKKHFLDVESLFRSKGWSVHYDKPGYNEAGEPYWEFRRARITDIR